MRMQNRGSMLVAALWGLMLLTAFSVSIGFGVSQKAALLSRLSTLDALYPIAYSGVEYAKSLVRSDSEPLIDALSDPWAVNSENTQPNQKIAEGSFVLEGFRRVTDEESKINLNKTSPEILMRLLQTVSGLGKDEAEEIAYSILDWMDSDSFFGHPQYGAEASFYEGLAKPYTAKDAPYETIDELLLVKGVGADIFEKIKPFLTIYGAGYVNLNTASAEVLAALGFSPEMVNLIVRYRQGGDSEEATTDDRFFNSVPSIASSLEVFLGSPLDISQAAVLSTLIDSGRIGVNSTFFSVNSRGTLLSSGASVEVEAVFNRKAQVFYHRMGNVQWPSRK